MTAPADKAENLASRRAEVGRLYCRGQTLRQIGEALGISFQLVHNDLKRLREEWRRVRMESYDRIVDEQLPKIDAIETAAWEGWEKSKQAAVRSKVEVDRDGDPQFLTIALKCVERRCKLIGADAPIKYRVDELDRVIESELARLVIASQNRTPGAPPGPQRFALN